MNFIELRKLIKEESKNDGNSFENSGDLIQNKIFNLNRDTLRKLVIEIGTIPEDIKHDSSEEKLYSKTTDILLAKTLHELGINATVNKERANCADVVGRSSIYGYSLVGDAKAFRLSRTAKNQKDFKVKSMIDWKGEHNYAVLVCPYYQYPKSNSQIYGQALDGNVCLLSWEHLSFLLGLNIKESKSLNLSLIWNISERLAETVTIKDKNKNTNFHEKGNHIICTDLSVDYNRLISCFNNYRKAIVERGEKEIKFWEAHIQKVKTYTKEYAIEELISALKLKEKINAIKSFIETLRD
ncbi:MAG: HindIII family type II restriction endonuclease [Bacteroidetes bacterium]|nr:HindIII family type II restriction endonuclease [Bacteroidota bacterium]MBU1678638.1 HindIII family type II restriction endonuclease [Bacteroidota bacterium]